jgi:uncharacterized protein
MMQAAARLLGTVRPAATHRVRHRLVGVIGLIGVVLALSSLGQDQAAAAGRAVVYAALGHASVATVLARAERGDIAAAARLGHLYETGQGVPQDYYEAAKWYYRAATAGHGGAQYALAMLYNKGRGVRRDYVLSYMWLNLSAAQAVGADHDFKVNMRDSIATKLTQRQLQAAQELALDWYKTR